MLLEDLNNRSRFGELIFNKEHIKDKQLYVLAGTHKFGPFSSEENADKFIATRKDLKGATKKWS